MVVIAASLLQQCIRFWNGHPTLGPKVGFSTADNGQLLAVNFGLAVNLM